MKKGQPTQFTQVLLVEEPSADGRHLERVCLPEVGIQILTSKPLLDDTCPYGRCVFYELLVDIRKGRFFFIESHEPDGTIKRRKCYGGTPRSRKGSVHYPRRGYCFTWTPTKRELTVWALDNDKSSRAIKLTTLAARALTRLIKKQLRAQDW